MPRVASRFGVNVAGALPFQESGAIRGLDGGFHIVLVVEIPVTVLVDREDRIVISHAGDVGLVLFEADINALLAQ